MNKISLKNLNLKEVEQLSREQLKNVLGGFTGGTGGTGTDGGTTGGCGIADCSCDNGNPGTVIACDEISCEECVALCDVHCNPPAPISV